MEVAGVLVNVLVNTGTVLGYIAASIWTHGRSSGTATKKLKKKEEFENKEHGAAAGP